MKCYFKNWRGFHIECMWSLTTFSVGIKIVPLMPLCRLNFGFVEICIYTEAGRQRMIKKMNEGLT